MSKNVSLSKIQHVSAGHQGSHQEVWIDLAICFRVIPDGGHLQKHLGSLINKYICSYYSLQVFLVVLHFHAQSVCNKSVGSYLMHITPF
jgi:hypothetical protein